MKAIILAAGSGLRLNHITEGAPKCLLRVGGISLIERQIRELRSLGISDVTVVVGCGADLVRNTCGPDCEYVLNDRFHETNSLFSLWLAREHMRGGFIVLNADVLFDPRLLTSLITSDHEDALLFQPTTEISQPLGDEEMKVTVRDGKVVHISKSLDPMTADGENVGIAKFGVAGADLLLRHMDQLISFDGQRAWVPRAFQEFSKDRALYAISTNGHAWIEIDFAEDYVRAESEILPMIRPAG